MANLKRFVIERNFAGIGDMSALEHSAAAGATNFALERIGPEVQWRLSYVAAEKTFCIYLAADAASARRHGTLSDVPIHRIAAVLRMFDPPPRAVNSRGKHPPSNEITTGQLRCDGLKGPSRRPVAT